MRRDTTLVGLPRIARILHTSRPTAERWALRRYFPTVTIEGRIYAQMCDVLAYREALRGRRQELKTA